MESGLNMFRNDVVMTPLRVKQAIDSRFVKPSEDELNVLINGTWVEFVKVGGDPVLPPAVSCAELLTMYKGDTTLTETPVINATGCTSLKEVFKGCTNLKTVKYIHTPNVTNMYGTFRACPSLTSIPEMDTSNVTNMYGTFRGCSSLTSIPELDTSSVTSMYYMFNGCSSLTSVTFIGDVVPPYSSSMFTATPIASGNGYIFVPDNMVDAYKGASGWSNHASVIRGIGEKDTLQSNISMYNMQIKETPTMFAMTEHEELEMMRIIEEEAPLTGMKK